MSVAHLAVERQLAEEESAGEVGDDLLRRQHDADGNRKIIRRAFFSNVRRREIDGDAISRESEAGVADGGADTLFGLLDGGIRQADDVEPRHSRGDVDLDLDDGAFEADDCA